MPKNWRGKLPVPRHAGPLVKRLFHLLNSNELTIQDIADRAGLNWRTISDWRYNRGPTLDNYEAVINALGYEINVAPVLLTDAHATAQATEMKFKVNGKAVNLSPSQSRLLLCIMGRVLATYEVLSESIWPDADEMPYSWRNILGVLVCQTNKKLKNKGWRINSRHSVGYQLVKETVITA